MSVPPQKILTLPFGRLACDDCDWPRRPLSAAAASSRRKALSSRCLHGWVIGGKVAWSSDSRGVALRLKVNRRWLSARWVRGRYATGLWPCQWIRLPMSNRTAAAPRLTRTRDRMPSRG